ncbi:histidine kinase [Opitutus sp. GAS368]|uniref:histidine kinase n=1 Tax=Opitutus sp. GAS368 TaxID=1882749 RepID=UPI00087BFE9B|nr:histidine kinase [Opitutus sp. GAS368]SDR67793.1 Signal transduction histidine kinase [Opitutus sp. GAS368]
MIAAALGLLVSLLPAAEPAPATLRTAAEALALPPEVAMTHLPVAIRGIVTAAEPDWAGKFFVQDESGGIFVSNAGRQPAVGDVVEVTGVTGPGAFAPVISNARCTKVGRAPLPPARHATIERLMAGAEDSQRVEITGLVRAAYFAPTRKLLVEVSLGAYRIRVFPKLPPQINPESLIAAKVTVRGTAATSFNAALRQLTAVNLYVPTAEDFVVEQREPHPPFEQPVVKLGDIARYRPNVSLGERLHVSGTVTLQRVGQDFYIQDDTGGLHLESQQNTPLLAPGDVVEAVGFLELINFQPVLKDAVFRRGQETALPLRGRAVPYEELRNGQHPAELIVLRGKLLDRSLRPVRRDGASFAGQRVTCTIQTPDLTFTAECEEATDNLRLAAVPLGSLVELHGIATFETGDDGKLKALNLLLPEASSLVVLETPSWFTAERLLVGLAIVCVLLAGLAAWSLSIAKKNAMLGILIAERQRAERELQQAHDHLEERVRERTEQLKVEMTARKTAELEFRAVLSERTRLARELHDTLEQALTGIALQLDTAAKLFSRNPEDASQRLELARGFLRQSQLELRRSIWDLRSRELEQFDLAEALTMASRQIATGTPLHVDVAITGKRRRLPEIVEENLLRIGQEAMTNVVKHSHATRVVLRLEFLPNSVALEIRDNGRGLSAERVGAYEARQFGLLGMSERAKRLGGRLDLSGTPGEGTTVRAVIPLETAAESPVPPVPAII